MADIAPQHHKLSAGALSRRAPELPASDQPCVDTTHRLTWTVYNWLLILRHRFRLPVVPPYYMCMAYFL